jgi:hypothetical protein
VTAAETVGAGLPAAYCWCKTGFDLTIQVQKSQKSPYLYPVHHLISQMRHFALFLCTSRLLKSGSNASYDKKFAETFP